MRIRYKIINCMICIGILFSSIPLQVQSSNTTVQPLVSIPSHLKDVPRAYITGYVLDEDGKPIPYAYVTLWQDNNLWHANYSYVPSDNPQTTRISYTNESGYDCLHEGAFLFGYTYPGEYILTVEKDGYKSSPVKVHVSNDTLRPNQLESAPLPIYVNITLSGYHIPTITPSQRANTGAIIGSLQSKYGYGGGGINVSLWQNGQLVNIPDNPQISFQRNYSGKDVDYVFEHLAPGQYTVMIEYYAGTKFNENVSVSVGTDITIADIMIPHEPPPPLPSPALSSEFVILVLLFVTYSTIKRN